MERMVRAAWMALALVACSRQPPVVGAAERSGGKMGETSVRWLGGGGLAVEGNDEDARELDPRPVVLWSGERPGAVIGYGSRTQAFGLRQTRSFRRVDGGPNGPFPVESSTHWKPGSRRTEDGYSPSAAVTADVDGDGTEELILPKWKGEVEVVGVKGELPGYRGPGVNASVATYRPMGSQVARLGTGAVVHVLFERQEGEEESSEEELKRAGAGDAYVLVRVDRSGAKRVVLGDPGYPIRSVLAVGAVNRPGSAQVDELLVVARRDQGGDVYLSRHKPDGAPVAPGRKVYVPFEWAAPSWSFAFVPQSTVAVLHATDVPELHFVEAEKPVNWIRRVELKPILDESERVRVFGVADARGNPKAVVSTGLSVYAVDVEGKYYAGSGGGLVPAPAKTPLYTVQPPGPEYVYFGMVPTPARADEWLVVHTRKAQPRTLTHEEISEAADRFLLPEEVEKERRAAVPALDDDDFLRDESIDEERTRKGFHAEIKTSEDWKRFLPDSYAATAKRRRERLDRHLKVSLTTGLEDPTALTPSFYRDPEGARAWLAGLPVPAETLFTQVRSGAVVRTLRVERELASASFGELVRPLADWRDGPTGTTVVAGLREPGDGKKLTFGYAVLTAPQGR
jgi:hypothetical protein